ncbi:MAG TPA: nuclear transport factor 2 family protein [Candidatus Saccharimonadia bacterium]|nr:nuclear transport factor 2 family protein [Candidatus Saccharimonadia bacterium]
MRDKQGKPLRAALLCALLAACGGDSPEDAIRATIAEMEAAVEARQPAGFLEHVSDDFAGQRGAFDRSALRGYLATLLFGNQLVEVTLTPASVTLHGDSRATVKLNAFVIGGARLPERGERLAIESGWRLEDGEWKVYAARWE